MRKNFIKIFVLIFLISNLIFSENKKLNENYGIEDGEVGKSSVADEKIMKFRVKREFEELAYYLVKEAHPYETAVINVFRMEV